MNNPQPQKAKSFKLLLFFLLVLITSCQENDQSFSKEEINFVDVGMAQDLVNNLQLDIPAKGNAARTTSSNLKKIETIVPVPDETGNTLYYVISKFK